MKRIVEEKNTITINGDGEIIHQEKEITTKAITREPPYVKMYIEDLGRVYDITQGRRDILCEIVKYINFQGEVVINKVIRERIAANLRISDGSIKNAICCYVKKGIFNKKGNTTYDVNPNLFAKGSWPEIYKRRCDFEMKISYSSDGRREVKANAKPSRPNLKAVS